MQTKIDTILAALGAAGMPQEAAPVVRLLLTELLDAVEALRGIASVLEAGARD